VRRLIIDATVLDLIAANAVPTASVLTFQIVKFPIVRARHVRQLRNGPRSTASAASCLLSRDHG
jgi:hypothetical protein